MTKQQPHRLHHKGWRGTISASEAAAASQDKSEKPTVLQTIKAGERGESIMLIIDDLEAMKVMEAWQAVPHNPVDRPLRSKEKMSDALENLWLIASVNITAIADLAKVPLNVANREFARLRLARLIYPDGTLHKTAKAILSNRATSYVKSILQ